MFYVYAITSKPRKYIYVGITNDVERRISQHQKGSSKTTRAYRPFEICVVEEFPTRPEARDREKYLKSGAGKSWLRKRFEEKN